MDGQKFLTEFLEAGRATVAQDSLDTFLKNISVEER